VDFSTPAISELAHQRLEYDERPYAAYDDHQHNAALLTE